MSQKSVLITGCSSGGCGESLAKEFHKRGFLVFATARDLSKVQALTDLGIITLVLDTNSQESTDHAVQLVKGKTGGTLNMLINNAAVFSLMPVIDVDIEDAKATFDANFFGTLRMIKAFLPLILATPEGSRLIANVSSISSLITPAWQGIYSCSKSALNALGHVLKIELTPLGVKVTTVMSGTVETAGKTASMRQAKAVPENSLFKALAEDIETHTASRDINAIHPDLWAQQVAGDLLRSKPKPVVWRGTMAFLGWMTTWFGTGVLDGYIIRASKLDTITAP